MTRLWQIVKTIKHALIIAVISAFGNAAFADDVPGSGSLEGGGELPVVTPSSTSSAVESYNLTAVNPYCYKECKKDCVDAFSQKIQSTDLTYVPAEEYPAKCRESIAYSKPEITAPLLSPISRELNEDIILNCRIACQIGDNFSSFRREMRNYNIAISENPIVVPGKCINAKYLDIYANTNSTSSTAGGEDNGRQFSLKTFNGRVKTFSEYYDSQTAVSAINSSVGSSSLPDPSQNLWKLTTVTFKIDPKTSGVDKKGFKASFATAKDEDFRNKIYFCGAKSQTLDPMISNMDPNVWNLDTLSYDVDGPSQCWTDKYQNNLVADANNSSVQLIANAGNVYCSQNFCIKKALKGNRAISNKNLSIQENQNKAIYQGGDPDGFGESDVDICKWSVRNKYPTSTYIFAKDGDEISIEWGGKWGGANNGNNLKGLYSDFFKNRNAAEDKYTEIYKYSALYFENNKNFYALPNAEHFKKAPHLCCIGKKNSCIKRYSYNAGVIETDWCNEGEICDYKGTDKIDNGTICAEVKGTNTDLEKIFAPKINQFLQANDEFGAYGLKASVQDRLVEYCAAESETASSDCGIDNLLKNWDKCFKVTDPGYSIFTMSGTLSNFNDTSMHLRPFFYNDGIYEDNVGGIDVKINWKGCAIAADNSIPNNDQQSPIQWAIRLVPENGAPLTDAESLTLEWNNFTLDQLKNNVTIEVQSKALCPNNTNNKMCIYQLYLRAQPDIFTNTPISNPAEDDVNRYVNEGYRLGSYDVSVTMSDDFPACDNSGVPILREVVNTVYLTLFGGDFAEIKISGERSKWIKRPGVLKTAYITITQDSKFIGIIRALLVLYIALTGIFILIGLIESNTQELIIRLLKFGFVLSATSATGWDFLYSNFFVVFIEGSFQIATLFIEGSYVGALDNNSCYDPTEPTSIFKLFDGPMKYLFSSLVWSKIGTLMLTGVVGFPIAIILIISVFNYIIALVKATLIYSLSLMGMGILIFLSPLFIPMILFKFTKDLFEKWWKGLLSFAMQNIFVLAGVGLFNLIIILTYSSAFAFSIASDCKLKIIIPGLWSSCLIPGYQLLSSLYVSSDVLSSIPATIIISSMAFMIVSHAMFLFVNFAPELAENLISGPVDSVGASGLSDTTIKSLGGATNFTQDIASEISASTEQGSRFGQPSSGVAKRPDAAKKPDSSEKRDPRKLEKPDPLAQPK